MMLILNNRLQIVDSWVERDVVYAATIGGRTLE